MNSARRRAPRAEHVVPTLVAELVQAETTDPAEMAGAARFRGPRFADYVAADAEAHRRLAITQSPQFLAVREGDRGPSRIEYLVGRLDQFDRADDEGWRLDQLYVDRFAPEDLRAPTFAHTVAEARTTAMAQSGYWGVPFCYASRGDTHVVVALSEWPRYQYAGWQRHATVHE